MDLHTLRLCFSMYVRISGQVDEKILIMEDILITISGTYLAALRASQMQKKQSALHGDIGDIDRFLERADELASAGDRPAEAAAAVMMRAPTLRQTPTGSRHGSPKVTSGLLI